MAEYRSSYRKTVAAASLAAAGALVAFAVLLKAASSRPDWSPAAWTAWTILAALLALAAGVGTLVANGGLISLRRDALEASGQPYAPRSPREWRPGRVTRRALLAVERVLGSRERLQLRPGDEVEVRSLPEILATLDQTGMLNALPFMPEMAACCGRRFRVFRRVDKLNDWVGRTGLRRVTGTVLLEQVRCDGSGHSGCQAGCAIRWNEAWLRRPAEGDAGTAARVPATAGITEADLARLAQRPGEDGTPRWICQVTELGKGTTPLARSDPRHYLRDLVRGNVRPGPLLDGVSIGVFNWVQRKRRGVTYPVRTPALEKHTPTIDLGLEAGDLVRVRSKRQIEQTLNARCRNRGLSFDIEMLRFCGATFHVGARVTRLIEERTGKLIELGNPCIILDGVAASGEYHAFCAQNESIFWKEIWLERTSSQAARRASREPDAA